MYQQFFGFTKLPFRLRPDPEFRFAGPAYLQARAGLLAGLRSARLVVFSGAPGVGKTLLLEDVLAEVSGQFASCRINQPHISAAELIQALLLQLAPSAADDVNRPGLFNELVVALEDDSRPAPPLLVIDDAQLLEGATLATLGDMLARVPRLKILLAGREDSRPRAEGLPARLAGGAKPRVVTITPLSDSGTKAYVEHRLQIAGGGGKELFTEDAYTMIFQHSGGAPRLINVLCDAALHAACLRASGHVTSGEILAATQDSRWPEALARDRASAVPVREIAPAAAWDPAATTHAPPVPIPVPVPRPAPALKVVPEPQAAASPPAVPEPQVALEPQAASPPPPGPELELTPMAAPARAHLIVSLRKEHLATLALDPGRLSIGRASDNAVRLDAPYISRHHCQVVTVGNISTIEDLGSVNGLSVNGKMVKRHILENADQVALGQHVLTYLIG